MLSPFNLHWAPSITISFLYLILFLKSLLRIPQSGGAFGEDLRRYYADFPWNDYCFCVKHPTLCAECITEVSGMEAYIPHSFSQPKPSKPWFNTPWSSRAIHDRECEGKWEATISRPQNI
ncbi:hypothetical protein E2C01_082806 [Portunus trituberculatus]|uniref:Uncharacterized protein n=1 Tax=Portunus trituberculatus TaxID=210409 RepID=A0A5B7J642_PORTR|nr:hypothetical protein [Portunus trituberculatus]